jgi:DNA-binding LacI/PurR family transcriptional regulator
MNAKLESDCVFPDDRAGAQMATAELIRQGHRRVALVHLNSPKIYPGKTFEEVRSSFHYSVVDRNAGYSSAMKKAGLSPRITFNDRFVADEELVSVCVSLLSGPDRPTAIIAYSEYEIMPLLLAATQLKLSIPTDLTVLGFTPTDQRIAGIHVPAIRIPTAEIGRRAVRMLLRKIESPNDPCGSEAITYEPGVGAGVRA